MSERKVLNKYYPPDFDPAKIPRLHLPKDRQYTVRLMAPCNMRCKTCGEYIYKGKKFNARKETVQGEDYLGIKVFRFYIKCTRCLAEITFKTDPQFADYIVEHGATRNFQALKLAEEAAEREQKELEEEEANNPMKLLENRTKASKNEMEILESLEELKDLNQRQANVDFDSLLDQNAELARKLKAQQEDEDEAFIQSVFGNPEEKEGPIIKRLSDDESSDEEEIKVARQTSFLNSKSSDILVEGEESVAKKAKTLTNSGVGSFANKKTISSLIKRKTPGDNNKDSKSESSNSAPAIQIKSQGLSLLGNYADSDSEESS